MRAGTWRADRHEHVITPIDFPPIPPRPVTHFVPQIPFDFDDLIEQHWGEDVWTCLDSIPTDLSVDYAKKWVWDASDEFAIANGCRFDLKRAMHFAYTCRNSFKVWEGRHAGDPFIARTWQPEFLLRCFGWVRPCSSMGWLRRYSKAAAWVTKKTGKTPVAAVVGNYLWRYDGTWSPERGFRKVQGQHVYSMARNGVQAGLVHRHAYLMALNSPMIRQEFDTKSATYHKTTHILTHQPSNSTYEKLSGDGPKNQQTGEGLNAGGMICDEAHVVDQNMVDVTTDAGASADQYLWFQISTAGSGDGYGKRDMLYGQAVAKGEEEDDAFLYRYYGAPQDISDEQCADPEVWKAANPAWDFTVNPRQFEDAFKRARKDPGKFSAFKRRRLNIWQDADNPMIFKEQWAELADSTLSLDDFEGRSIAAAIDLAAVNDFCAFAMVYQDADDVYNLWVKFWCADTFHRKYGDRTPANGWALEDIEVHAGEVRLSDVQEQIEAIIHRFDIEVLGYDRMYAQQMAQNLREVSLCQIVEYPQTLRSYANGTALFTRAIANKRLRHPGQPVLDWMAGHVQAHEHGDMRKPQKDETCPWNKIDGIQAAVMAIDCVHYTGEQVGTAYEEGGNLSL